MRHVSPVVAALAIAVVLVLAVGATATPGPGGWDNLGTGGDPTRGALNGAVYALNTDAPGVLLVGGAFTDAGGSPGADYIARWNGSAWAALGSSTLNGAVHAVAWFGGRVYVGGVFTNAGGNANADFLAVWNGESWGTVCNSPGSAITGNVSALEVIGSTLYVGGAFQNGAGIASADYLVACDLTTGAARSTVDTDGDFAGVVYALTSDGNGNLYAGGGFNNLDRIPAADRVAYFDGAAWHGMGSGPGPGGGAITDFVRSLASSGNDIYVGTDALDVAGLPRADHVAKWDGAAWSALGSNAAGTNGWFPTSASINSLITSGAGVYAGGSFQDANGDPRADQIAYFDGSAWRAVGSDGAGNGPLNGNVTALAIFGGKLIAGGSFANAGGNRLASSIASFLPGAAPPVGAITGTPTGRVLLNGRPFAGGPVPFGSRVDVTDGRLLLKTTTGSLLVYGNGVSAIFLVLRGTDRGKPLVELRLAGGDFGVCKRRPAAVSAVKPPPKVVRQLWGKGKGRFRTKARYSAATVRGTSWLTADRCDGTLTRVTQGTVQVSDFPRRKSVLVRAGKSYLAKKP